MIFLVLFSLLNLNATEVSSSHFGCWKLESVKWQNKIRPPFNPNLQLYFILYKNDTLRVYWNFKNDPDTFCERVSRYNYDGEILDETVMWLHPENSPECSKDPDMHVGRNMLTPLSVENDKLTLHLTFSGDNLDYIYKGCQELP